MSKAQLTAMESFSKKWSKNIVDKARRAGTRGYWTTGSRKVDAMLGGGFPQAELIELYGQSGSGKSTLALSAAANILKTMKPTGERGRVAYIDLERGLDYSSEKSYVVDQNGVWIPDPKLIDAASTEDYVERRKGWLRKNGINPFDENFLVISPDHGEQMFQIIHDMFGLVDLIIVDSVAAMLTRSQLEGDPGEAGFGAVAKLLGVELPRLLRIYDTQPETLTSVIFINQTRDKIGYMSNGGKKSFGGNALEFFVSTKLYASRVKRIRKNEEVITHTRIRIDKSRHAAALECMIQISSDRGLDTVTELIEIGSAAELIHTSGAWYFMFEEPMPVDLFDRTPAKKREGLPAFVAKVKGESATIRWLQENGWQDRLEKLDVVIESAADPDDE